MTPSETGGPTDIYGCTDESALNYGHNCEGEFVGDPTIDDGCCDYPSNENPFEGQVTPTPSSGVFQGQATLSGTPASEGDWIAAFDGDGNILMNLGSLVTIGAKKPKNFIHFIFDNNSHESTGSQPTNSNKIDIEKIAMATKFKIFRIKSKIQLKDEIPKIIKKSGPIMVLIDIENGGTKSARINISASEIKQRFMISLKQK